MPSAAQIHLGLNHAPIFGILIGFIVLLISTYRKDKAVQNAGLAILFVAAIFAAPVYFSGEPAEEIIEDRPGISKTVIHDHEESAELAIVFVGLTGFAAVLAYLLARKGNSKLARNSNFAVLFLAGFTLVLLAQTAHKGGLIQHRELGSPAQDNP